MIRRTIRRYRNRRQLSQADRGVAFDIAPTADDPSGSTATLTFPVPMTLGPVPGTGEPGLITCGSEHLVSVVATTPMLFVLTFSGAVSSNPIIIPQQCPTFRSYQGGYPLAGVYPTS